MYDSLHRLPAPALFGTIHHHILCQHCLRTYNRSRRLLLVHAGTKQGGVSLEGAAWAGAGAAWAGAGAAGLPAPRLLSSAGQGRHP